MFTGKNYLTVALLIYHGNIFITLRQVRALCSPLVMNRQRPMVCCLLKMVEKVKYYCFLIRMQNGQTLLSDSDVMFCRSSRESDNKQQPSHVRCPESYIKYISQLLCFHDGYDNIDIKNWFNNSKVFTWAFI